MAPFLPLSSTWQAVSPRFAEVLFQSIWIGTLLTAVLALVFRTQDAFSARLRAGVWTAVLLTLLVLPGVIAFWPHSTGASHPAIHVVDLWSELLLLVWAACTLFRLVQLGRAALQLRGILRRAQLVPVTERIASRLAGWRRTQLCVSAEVDRPSVAGLLRPRVLLPTELLQALNEDELEQVVLHEMEHLRRGDDWLNVLQLLSVALMPLNPVLLWLDRTLCRERELACDDGVLAAAPAHTAYATCLVKLAESSLLRRGVHLALSTLGSGARPSELVMRVQRILAGGTPAHTPRSNRWLLAGAGVLSVMFVAGALAGPQWVRFDAAVSPAPELAAVAGEPTSGVHTHASSMVPTVARVGFSVPQQQSPAPGRPHMVPLGVAALPQARVLHQGFATRTAALTLSRPREQRVAWHGRARQGHLYRTVAIAHFSMPPSFEMATFQDDLSPRWAAVAVQGGWLLVQL